MKKIANTFVSYGIGAIMALCLLMGNASRAKACFDIIPTIHTVTCYYDTTHFQELVVRVSSLRLLANPPGTYCTCALHNNAPILDWIRYIAVVDSGTNHRVDGFAEWYRYGPASSGWDSIYQIIWDGFLTQVEGAGITNAGAPIELIIRVQITPGYAIIPMRADLPPTILGWGNWDNNLQRPASNRWWLNWPTDSNFIFVPIHEPSTFFADFDQDLLYTGVDEQSEVLGLKLFPNPAVDILNIRILKPNSAIQGLDIYDGQGRLVMQDLDVHSQQLTVDVKTLPAGNYFVKLQTAKGCVTQRFLKH